MKCVLLIIFVGERIKDSPSWKSNTDVLETSYEFEYEIQNAI